MSKAFVFDFDDTLAVTETAIKVLDGDKVVDRLTSAQFSEYKIQDGHEFCFRDFTDPTQIINAKPRMLLEFAKIVAEEKHGIYILTARRPAVADAIQAFLGLFGIVATIICVGGRGRELAKYKAEELTKIAESYTVVYFYDDDDKNLESAKKIGIKTIKATH